MSDKKREIHVKDLIIKAENVIFEQPRHEQPRRRQFDPFFGPRRVEGLEDEDRKMDVEAESDFHEESSSSSSSEHDDNRRRPFSWI
ncbi:hypothetical protein [Salirhabdus sp. Marseille-P4669]|uniref:hypothetical protein n=1 Tax=Salirhabdus sp. Marseille-P4669 TaxID=2042310 RepID=UPI000C7E6BC2|nr:hypothetical protein [Salirhabdus sp. Marseille-P4669]